MRPIIRPITKKEVFFFVVNLVLILKTAGKRVAVAKILIA